MSADSQAGIVILDARALRAYQARIEGRSHVARKVQWAVKRSIDIAAALFALVVLLPLFAALAIAIRLDSPGPVFYRQRRMGRHGRNFHMWKFRSMVNNADSQTAQLAHLNEGHGPFFKMSNDPRVTRVGRFIRRTSIDELPQLINVLRGEMTLVGPRPFLPQEYAVDPHLFSWRLAKTPGITGPWQVAGCSKVPLQEAVNLDRQYALGWNLLVDLQLLFKTVGTVYRQATTSRATTSQSTTSRPIEPTKSTVIWKTRRASLMRAELGATRSAPAR